MSEARTITRMSPHELREREKNPRRISAERFEALKYAVKSDPQMLEARPLVVTQKGEVLMGNMRLRAAQELGLESVPVYIVDFDDPERLREWMVRDNIPYGEWVSDLLAEEMSEHEAAGGDLKLLGFSDQELKDLRGLADDDTGGDAPDDDIPPKYAVVVECDDESTQGALLERLEGEGYTTRALML